MVDHFRNLVYLWCRYFYCVSLFFNWRSTLLMPWILTVKETLKHFI